MIRIMATAKTIPTGAAAAALCALLLVGPAAADETTPAQPPEDSPLAKIQKGMLESEVVEILGAPDQRTSYRTGKSRIPFYFGGDARRLLFQYSGLGKVILSRGRFRPYTVMRVEYDPNELAGDANRGGGRTTVVVPIVDPRPRVPGPRPRPRHVRPRRPF